MGDSNNINPLGKPVEYPCDYQPSLLFAIERKEKRIELGIDASYEFHGEDIWNAYEISWLNQKGIPQVAIGEIRFPHSSPRIVESKSFKLYLNSLNQTRFSNIDEVKLIIANDLSVLVGSDVWVSLESIDESIQNIQKFESECIDQLDIENDTFEYSPRLLRLEGIGKTTNLDYEFVNESLCSHLLKSNCLITHQPDWASIVIEYKGPKISHASLLKYIISFRMHNEFHEQCVERVYCDLINQCNPSELTVYARYTRRGGIDINPWRSNCKDSMANTRMVRQ